jgi:uncharacterized Zn finger protein (UPF0148 family)
MNDYNTIRIIHIKCPLCGKIYEVEEIKRIAATIIKDEKVTYEEIYYFCPDNYEEENEFTTGKIENINLLNVRNAYKKLKDYLPLT